MSRLYKRAVSLSITKPRGFFTDGTNRLVVENLRVEFRVEKHIGKEPNTCSVTVSNLAPETRAQLQSKPLRVRLDAGYDGQLKRLFVGDLAKAPSTPERTGWSTTLEVGDGERAMKHARVNRSYKAGVTARTAIKEAATAMGLKVPAAMLQSTEFSTQFVSGLTVTGPASVELTRLLDRAGMTWSIQDGRLQILRERQSRDDAPLVVSQANGMIGSPQFGAPPKKGGKPVLTVESQLYPEITAGGRILVQSLEVEGAFRVDRVTHAGDTHGPQFTTRVEAREV